jgi:hypothetical protein
MYRRATAVSLLGLFGLVALMNSTDDSTQRVFLVPQAPQPPQQQNVFNGALRGVQSIPAAATAAYITFQSEAAHAKSVLGVNGQLDFGPLAGDQPGGEGTGKALGINDDSLGFALLTIVVIFAFLFNQWQGYQDDEEDFFDGYDSRRTDRQSSIEDVRTKGPNA